jgi:YHS domain-containing protein
MFAMPVVVSRILAAEETTHAGTTDVGNKFCPVTGDPVSEIDFVEYQGKRYGLCCPMCEKLFLKDPSKYITKSEVQEKTAQASGTTPVSPLDNMTMDM